MAIGGALRFLGIAAGCLAAVTGAKASVYQDINSSFTPGFFFWAAPSGKIGWYWTPSTDVDLTAIHTELNTSGNNINNAFTLTTAIYTDRPAAGGTLIDSFTFNAAGYGGGFTGGSFVSPVHLTGGTAYFIGFSGWDQVNTGSGGGGVNWVEPSEWTPAQQATIQNLFPGYTGNTWEIQMNSGPPANIDMPILEFLQFDAPVTSAPEPASLAGVLAGLAVLAAARKARRATL
jgi:hypothetical protein